MNNPLVSICIPTYNGEKFLRQCIDSCLAQTLSDYEIVICDDGSADSTISIINEYANANTRIRFFENKQNLGLVGNWNKCLEVARGEWIKFVFQDDYISPDCIEVFVNSIEHNVHLMVSERNFILEGYADEYRKKYYSEIVRTLDNVAASQKKDFFTSSVISKLAVKHLGLNFIAEPSLTFFRKEIVKKTGVFNPLLKQICDLEFLLRIGSEFGLKHVRKKICFFRIHGESTTNTNQSSNYFQLRYMEPVLLSWLLLYDAGFKNFRDQLNAYERFRLRLWFRLKCYEAGKVADEQSQYHAVFDEQQKQFAEIRKNRTGSWLVKLILALRR